tara:strand:+ start:790 stop:1353 length:564 start_codon:yes stop_codon:yes gene_type:complete
MAQKHYSDIEVLGTVTASNFVGHKIVLGSASGFINKTASALADDGTDKVYVGSSNYGWNDARDWATQIVDVDAPVLAYNDQHCGIICPVDVSQVSIMSQLRINSADSVAQVKVYKGTRRSAVTGNVTLTEICSVEDVAISNSKFTSIDIVGTTAVAAGQLIVVGFGKTDGGNGQKPRFNFTLTGTTV